MIWNWDRAQILCTNNLFTLFSEAYAPITLNTRTKSFITIINRTHWLRLLEIPHKTLLELFLFRSFGIGICTINKLSPHWSNWPCWWDSRVKSKIPGVRGEHFHRIFLPSIIFSLGHFIIVSVIWREKLVFVGFPWPAFMHRESRLPQFRIRCLQIWRTLLCNNGPPSWHFMSCAVLYHSKIALVFMARIELASVARRAALIARKGQASGQQ